MKSKSKRIVVSLVVVIVLLASAIAGIKLYHYSQISNIFDELYYSIYQNYGVEDKSFFFTGLKTTYTKTTTTINILDSNYPYSHFAYSSRVLEDGEGLSFGISKDDKYLYFHYAPSLFGDDAQHLTMEFRYYPSSKTLEYLPISLFKGGVEPSTDGVSVLSYLLENHLSMSDIERYREHSLYDTIMNDFIVKNISTSRFSLDDFGDYQILDNTFSMLPEGWEASLIENEDKAHITSAGTEMSSAKWDDNVYTSGEDFIFTLPLGWNYATSSELEDYTVNGDGFFMVGLDRYLVDVVDEKLEVFAAGADGSTFFINSIDIGEQELNIDALLQFITVDTTNAGGDYTISNESTIKLGAITIDKITVSAPSNRVTTIGLRMDDKRLQIFVLDAFDETAYTALLSAFTSAELAG